MGQRHQVDVRAGALQLLLDQVRAALPAEITSEELRRYVRRRRAALRQAVEGLRLPECVDIEWFASGTNHPGDVRGWARAGQDIGVSVPELQRTGMLPAVKALAGQDSRLFVDSGAFSETDEAPLDASAWSERLRLYEDLAATLGPQLAVVAPDKVGDPLVSLMRLARWGVRYGELAAHGTELIVPLQRGPAGLVRAWRDAGRVLRQTFTPAVPGNKAAATDGEIKELLQAAQPARLHILGMGPGNPRASRLLALVALHSPHTQVSMDSNRRRALVGRSWNAPLTQAEDQARDDLAALARAGEPLLGADGHALEDYTDAIGEPSSWMTRAARRRLAEEVLPKDKRRPFIEDPESLLQEDCASASPPRWCVELDAGVEEAWTAAWERASTAERRARAISQVVS